MTAPASTIDRGLAYGPDPAHRFDLYRPAGATAPTSAVLSIRGGGWRDGRRDDPRMLERVVAPLVARGHTVAAIDYRHAPAHRFPAQRDDARRALDHVRDRAGAFGLDPRRIAAVGGSAGGHLAALLATEAGRDAERGVAAAVLLLAPLDLRLPRYLGGLPDRATRDALRKVLEELVGVPYVEDPAPWRAASPLLAVSAGTAPCFIVHGSADEVVPVAPARAFADALARAGVDVEAAFVPGLGHDLDERPDLAPAVDAALGRAWRFLDRHLAHASGRAC